MTVKLLLLKSGEDIIADVQEMVSGKSEEEIKVIGYFLNKPCIVKMRDSNLLSKENVEEPTKAAFQVSLYPWMPLTSDKVIPIPADWVVTMVEPVAKLTEMYLEDVIKYGTENNQNSSTNQRTDSDQSN